MNISFLNMATKELPVKMFYPLPTIQFTWTKSAVDISLMWLNFGISICIGDMSEELTNKTEL